MYNLFRINYDKLLYLSLASGAIWVGSFPSQFLRNHYRSVLFLLSVFMFFVGLLTWTWPFEKMYLLTREDSITEYAQFFVLLLGAVFSLMLSKKLWRKKRVISIIYVFVGICLLAVAGDEISWGQRLLNLQTPQALQAVNTQQEITFHNIISYEIYVTYGYILLGLYGSIISLFINPIISNKSKKYFLPPNHLFFYFFVPLCVQSTFFVSSENDLRGFAELSELMLYMGITLFIIELNVFSKNNQQS